MKAKHQARRLGSSVSATVHPMLTSSSGSRGVGLCCSLVLNGDLISLDNDVLNNLLLLWIEDLD